MENVTSKEISSASSKRKSLPPLLLGNLLRGRGLKKTSHTHTHTHKHIQYALPYPITTHQGNQENRLPPEREIGYFTDALPSLAGGVR